jgi:CRISPR-associated protein Cst2
MKISGILVSLVAPFDYHMANGGEKLLGNASSIKRTPDGKVYVSGQMQRHALFSAMSRLNDADPNKAQTYVSNGDGISNHIEIDLRADMGGFMHPSRGDYSGRRTAPLTATMAVALEESKIGRDLLIRLKQDPNEDSRDQALATREFSENDMMLMNFYLDVTALSTSKAFRYEKSFHLETTYHKHAHEVERMRRVRLFLEATRSLHDYSNQARNAVSGEPLKILIVFDTKHSRKAARYFSVGETQQSNILAELKARQAEHFLGDDDTEDSVFKAYEKALALLAESTLVDLSEGDSSVVTFEEFAGTN